MAGMTIKQDFRWRFGYRHDHHCKECKYCQRWQMGNHGVYKCENMGISNSTATDIRLKDFACRLFVPEGWGSDD